MAPDDHRFWRERLGAYALGHSDADETAAVHAHTEGCRGCREELAELAPVVRRLSLGDGERVASSPAPPRDLGDRVLARVGRERRSRRARRRRNAVRGSFAAAAAVGVAAVAAIALVPRGDDEPEPARRGPPAETVAFRGLPPGVSMRATVIPRAWGTAITVSVRGAPGGILCVVWLERADGTRVSAGSFRYVDRSEGSRVMLAAALPRSDAVEVGLRAGRWTYVAPLP